MRFKKLRGLKEVVLVRVSVSFSSDCVGILKVLDVFILWIILEISLEVVSVLLFLFTQATEKVGVVVCPPLVLSMQHPLLSSLVVVRVAELASIELLYLVEDTVELADGLLDSNPSLVQISAVGYGEIDLLGGSLSLNSLESLMHSVELLVGFLKTLELVGWINKDAIGLVTVHMDVNVGAWDRLHVRLGSVTEERR